MFVATLLPLVPALIWGVGTATHLAALGVGLVLAAFIGWLDARGPNLRTWESYAISLGSFAFVTVPTVAFSIATGIAG